MSAKPVVTYKRVHGRVRAGQPAYVGGLKGHPGQASGRLEGELVRTSTVQRVASKVVGGLELVSEFETLNTIYRPEAE